MSWPIRATPPSPRSCRRTVDAVGFEAKGSTTETVLTNLNLEGSSGAALRQCIAATRRCGTVSVPGVYAGFIHAFIFGDAFDKGLTFKMGQTHAQALMPELLEHIGNGLIKPEIIISHRLSLADAAEGYATFDKAEDDCPKVVLTRRCRGQAHFPNGNHIPHWGGRICARPSEVLLSYCLTRHHGSFPSPTNAENSPGVSSARSS